MTPNSHYFQNTPLEYEFSSFRATLSPSVSRVVVLRPPGTAVASPPPITPVLAASIRRRPRQPRHRTSVIVIGPRGGEPEERGATVESKGRRAPTPELYTSSRPRWRRLDRRWLGARWRQPGDDTSELAVGYPHARGGRARRHWGGRARRGQMCAGKRRERDEQTTHGFG